MSAVNSSKKTSPKLVAVTALCVDSESVVITTSTTDAVPSRQPRVIAVIPKAEAEKTQLEKKMENRFYSSFHRMKGSVECNVNGFVSFMKEIPEMLKYLWQENAKLRDRVAALELAIAEIQQMQQAQAVVLNNTVLDSK